MMNDKLCGNCDYAFTNATNKRLCVKHRMYVAEDDEACISYFNYRKTQIYNKLLRTLGGITNGN